MTSKLKCLIVDDEFTARKGITEYIEDTNFLEASFEAQDPFEAMNIIKNNKVDLMFLDINMPKMSGIDFLKLGNTLPPVIITTAYQEYALEGYELDIIDYLLKPIPFERFVKAVKKAQGYIASTTDSQNQATDSFFVKSNGIYEQISYSDISAVESLQNYVIIHTNKGRVIAYLTLKLIMEKLPDSTFIQIHKSYVVSKKAIQSISTDSVCINDNNFPIGNSFKNKLFDEFINTKLLKR
ncbi:LytTR family DNA-binding domain-containing protein [Flavobacterium rakeshii]|uniref:LytR/AlgR family response regulator transcription factor n=1 Tax=Flavobacterium rakeshii TaxID=1038845 RepID=UPI002E7C554F|nr:LytTR family DNA-binding domain-containing protein [Flavobacterium rakeshii]MEE1898447.1 LytTR family DNA-binding domain-containing protein [Flavobacterium rakeshii]